MLATPFDPSVLGSKGADSRVVAQIIHLSISLNPSGPIAIRRSETNSTQTNRDRVNRQRPSTIWISSSAVVSRGFGTRSPLRSRFSRCRQTTHTGD